MGGRPPYLDFNPEEAGRLVWDRQAGTYKPPVDPYISRIPVAWIVRAGTLSKAALITGLVCLFLDGCNQRRPFKINRVTARKFGLTPRGRRRGIRELEGAGLVLIDRKPGQLPILEIIREFEK